MLAEAAGVLVDPGAAHTSATPGPVVGAVEDSRVLVRTTTRTRLGRGILVQKRLVPTTKRALLTLSHAMERAFDAAGRPEQPGVVIALFQRREYFEVESTRYAELASAGNCVVVGFQGSTAGLPPGVHGVSFTDVDLRALDWILVLVKGTYASALVARDARDLFPGEVTLEAARLFNARWTFQRRDALVEAEDQLARLAPELLPSLVSTIADVVEQCRSEPVLAIEAQLAAAIDHVVMSIDASITRAGRYRASLESLQALAERDQLTGLNNRHYLERFLGGDDRPTDLLTMLVDVDNLKTVNDTHGHAAGDAVLTAVADTLRQHSRSGDVIVRWGGDEFLLLIPNLAAEDGLAYAARLAEAVQANRPKAPWNGLALSVSIGACPTRRTLLPLDRLDHALWESKRAGKGRATLVTLAEPAS